MNTKLNTPAARRLETYKAAAAESIERWGAGNHYADWKNNRHPKAPVLYRGDLNRSQDGKEFYLDNLDQWPGTNEGDASDIIRLDHTGWFADNEQFTLIRGAVVSVRNPHALNDDGEHKVYFPAIYYTENTRRNPGEVLSATVYDRPCDSKEEAARIADSYAESEAEDAREGDAKYQAEQQIEDSRAEIHDLNKEALPLIREIKAHPQGYAAPVCSTIREKLGRILADREHLFNRIERLTDDYWTAVEN